MDSELDYAESFIKAPKNPIKGTYFRIKPPLQDPLLNIFPFWSTNEKIYWNLSAILYLFLTSVSVWVFLIRQNLHLLQSLFPGNRYDTIN